MKSYMKKVIALLLSLAMLLPVLGVGIPISVSAAAALPRLTDLSLDSAFVNGRTGVCYYGKAGLTSSGTFDALWSQSTNQDGYKYNSAASYSSAVTFNTFTVFQANSSYGNAEYAEIWYYNGTPTGADPLTYWTKADLRGVVVSGATEASALVQATCPGGGVLESYTWILSAPVTANNVMVNFVYDAARASGEGNVFQMLSYAGYDANYVSSSSAAALPRLTDLSLDSAFVNGRTGVCYYGKAGLTSSGTFDALWSQSTNQDGYKYNSAASYSSAVTFNTFTVFQANSSYGNAGYAEIWYYNGTPTGADPLTYWTKADLRGVVVSGATEASALVQAACPGGGVLESYTWILSAPVTANNVMVNFVYDAARASGEGNVFQMLSYAGYDAGYDSSSPSSSVPATYTVNSGTNQFTCTHSSNYAGMSLSTASNLPSGWPGNQYFLDGSTPYTWFLTYNSTVWANEIVVKALTSNTATELAGIGVYYSNGSVGSENWQKVSVTPKKNGDNWVFVFSEAVQAKYFMLHMATPSAAIRGNWLESNFYSVYDPQGGGNDSTITGGSSGSGFTGYKYKIFIDQGHNPAGYHNAGAQGYADEGLVTFNVGIALLNLLQSDGRFEVMVSRPTAATVLGTTNSSALSARSAAANSWGADYFISLHCNSASETAHGIEAYSYDTGKGWVLGQHIVSALCNATGFTMRKTATGGMEVNTSLAVLNSTNMPAVLIEMGFVTNANEAALMNSNPALFAQGIYNGIISYFTAIGKI